MFENYVAYRYFSHESHCHNILTTPRKFHQKQYGHTHAFEHDKYGHTHAFEHDKYGHTHAFEHDKYGHTHAFEQ